MGLLYSYDRAYDWKVVDADMRLKEPRKCDLVLSDHPEEMPWFAKPQFRYLFSAPGIFQVLIVLYLEKALLSRWSVTVAVVRMAINYGDIETRRVDGKSYKVRRLLSGRCPSPLTTFSLLCYPNPHQQKVPYYY